MKYTQFRNLVAFVAFLGIGGSCYGCYAWWQHRVATREAAEREQRRVDEERRATERAQKEREDHPAAAQANEAKAQDVARAQDPGSFWRAAQGLREVDVDALTLLRRPVVAKIKDGAPGKPYKINVYADDERRWNRLKIDLDRDEKVDETWTIGEDGRIQRKVATADDERYDVRFTLSLAGWQKDGEAPAVTTPGTAATPPTAGTVGLRDVDAELLRLVQSLRVQSKIKDATQGRSYKINLYSDAGARFERAKIDLDRDDKWDETWTFGADGRVERKVAPADDERYGETWVLRGASWTKDEAGAGRSAKEGASATATETSAATGSR